MNGSTMRRIGWALILLGAFQATRCVLAAHVEHAARVLCGEER